MKLFNTKPDIKEGISSMEVSRIVNFLADHFKVVVPKIKFSGRVRRGRYRLRDMTVIMGPKCWRGVHTAVHEFAHHLDLVRRGHAGAGGYKREATYVDGWITKIKRRSFHGESFTVALEDCVEAAFAKMTDYSWETEYRMVKKNHATRHFHPAEEKPIWKNPAWPPIPNSIPGWDHEAIAADSSDTPARREAARIGRLMDRPAVVDAELNRILIVKLKKERRELSARTTEMIKYGESGRVAAPMMPTLAAKLKTLRREWRELTKRIKARELR